MKAIGELPGTNMIQYSVPLPNRAEPCLLTLPRNLTVREVERIVAFLRTLIVLGDEGGR